MADVYKSGFLRDDATGALVIAGPNGASVGGKPDLITPTAVVAENMPWHTLEAVNASIGASGVLFLAAVTAPANKVITGATWLSGSTALSVGVNQWFALYDSARNLLRTTNDDGATAWGTNTFKTLNFSSTYTPTVDSLLYVGICIVATTVPSMRGINPQFSTILAEAPSKGGTSNGGLTNPASAPATANAPAASTTMPYVRLV